MCLCAGIYFLRIEHRRTCVYMCVCVCERESKKGRASVTQGLMGALSSFILIAAVADLSVTLATVAAG